MNRAGDAIEQMVDVCRFADSARRVAVATLTLAAAGHFAAHLYIWAQLGFRVVAR